MRYKTFCCNDIVESKHRHDFVRCKCGKCYVDGGNDYTRVGFDHKVKPPEPYHPTVVKHSEKVVKKLRKK